MIVFILICLMRIPKQTESLLNYQRYQYNDYGEGSDWHLHLKNLPQIVHKEYPYNEKRYNIIGENSYHNRMLVNTINDFFPLKKSFFNEYQHNFDYITKKVSNNDAQFGIVDETSLQVSFSKLGSQSNNLIYNTKYNIISKYLLVKKHSNIRFVGALYNKDLTFICKSKINIMSSYQISDMIIGCIKNSFDKIRLNLYLEATNNTTCQIIEYDNLKLLFDSFTDDKINILFLCCAHPSPYIIKLSKSHSIKIIDFQNDFTNKKISYLIPHLRKNEINMKMYNGIGMIKCLSFREVLISNTKVSKWIVYQFLYNYFNNFNYINFKTNHIFRKNLRYMFIYFINESVSYHDGSQLFFKKKGFIKYLTE